MRRREFITLLGGATAWPLSASAQQPAIPVVGYLSSSRAEVVSYLVHEFRDGLLAATGFVEGKNVAFEYRYAELNPDRLHALALDLVSRRVSVVGAVGYAGLREMRAATKTVPIIAIDLETDPVEAGFAASLARPGGNVTGIFLAFPELAAKWLELLKEASQCSRVAVLVDASAEFQQARKVLEAASGRLKVSLEFVVVRAASNFDEAFNTAVEHGADAILILGSPQFFPLMKRAAELAIQHRLPAFMWESEFARSGGLMGYGVNLPDTFRKAGALAGKVLQGTKPGDLAIERPTKFELIINLKTANAIGLTIPDRLLAVADEVIE